MKHTYILAASLSLAVIAGVSLASASEQQAAVSVIRGSAEVRQSEGWSQNSTANVGQWIRSTKKDTTVRVPGVTLRMEPGASVRVTQVAGKNAKIDAKGGRVYVKVDADRTCQVASASKSIQAQESQFVLDAGSNEKFYLVQGQATEINAKPEFGTLNSWSKNVALDGPDVRKRSKNRRRFTQGEENKGKRIGEDVAPTQTAAPQTPAYTPTPAQTPAYTPPPTPPPSPNPPPQQPTVTGGGGQVWPWIVGGLLVGTGTYFIVRDRDNEPDRVIFPISR